MCKLFLHKDYTKCSYCILLFFSYQIAMLANVSTDSSAREIDLIVST